MSKVSMEELLETKDDVVEYARELVARDGFKNAMTGSMAMASDAITKLSNHLMRYRDSDPKLHELVAVAMATHILTMALWAEEAKIDLTKPPTDETVN